MLRLLVGTLPAAAVMFLLGFVFYGTPLQMLGWTKAPLATQLAVQQALKALPESGTYVIPSGDTPGATTAYGNGPVAQIQYNSGGFAMVDPKVFAGGFVQMAVSVFLLGCILLTTAAASFGARVRLVAGVAATAVVYLHLAGPVWYHTDWHNAVYTAVADFIVLTAGGVVLARWFIRAPGQS